MKCSTIDTKRLQLVPLSTSFASDDYVNWMNDSEVNEYLESGGNYTLDMLTCFLKDVEKKDILFWAIIVKRSQKNIKNIIIDTINWKYGNGEYVILIGDHDSWARVTPTRPHGQ